MYGREWGSDGGTADVDGEVGNGVVEAEFDVRFPEGVSLRTENCS